MDALVLTWPNADGIGPATLGLTPRELDVLRLVARGWRNTAIGRSLGVSDRTVGKHLERVYTKLGVTNRTAAVHRAAPALEASGG
jgi:DNA-binding NarL/FixJ family response regulator